MIRILRSGGTRLIYLSMLILTLCGAALVAIPGAATAQMTSDPVNDPRCMPGLGGYICREVLSSTIDYRPVTTVESCNLGWSARQATQEVTTTEVYQVDEVLVELYSWDGVSSWYSRRSFILSPETYLYTTVEEGQCLPVTGRPPQN